MIKKILVFIILLIIFYDGYNTHLLLSNNKLEDTKKDSIINQTKTKVLPKNAHISDFENKNDINTSYTDINTSYSDINTNDIDTSDDQDVTIVKNVNKNLYGNPSDYKEGKYILWEFQNPNPWTKIIYKYNENYPFYFFIKIKIPSLNDYEDWKKIINNLDFDPRSGEIILPTDDEETALSIVNLMITHFNGDISIKDIVNQNLIDISINKARKYEVVKNKIREQIKQSTTVKTRESFKDLPKVKDLSNFEAKPDINDFNPYEGTEYSFL
jgi:hypothetical protein